MSLVWCPILKMSCTYHLNVCLDGHTKWSIPQGAGAAESRRMKRKTWWGSLEGGTYDFWSMSMVHVVGEALTAGRFIQPKKKVWSRLLTDTSHTRWFSLSFSNCQWFWEIASDCQLLVITVSCQPTTRLHPTMGRNLITLAGFLLLARQGNNHVHIWYL